MLIIFDLDGTLLDTIEDLAQAANHALKVCGFPVRSTQECRQFVGNGVTKLLERCLPAGTYNLKNIENMRQAFFAYYDAHLTDYTRPYASMEQVLEQLSKRAVKIAVCSNKYQRATQHLMKHFFPQIHFVAIQGQQEGVPVKPDPCMVEKILHLSGEPRENCLYVGDSDVDMQTARNAGVKACGVTWGFRPRTLLAQYKPAYLLDTPNQLLLLPEVQDNNK